MKVTELFPKDPKEKGEKKTFKIAFDIYVHCTDKQSDVIFQMIRNYIVRSISSKKILRIAGGVTDKLYGSKR